MQGGSTLTMQLVRNLYLPQGARRHAHAQAQDHRGEAGRRARAASTRSPGSSTSYLNDVDYGTVGGQTAIGVRRRRADVLRQARRGSWTSRSRRCWPACRRRRPSTTRSATPPLRHGPPPRGAAARWSQSRLHHPGAGRRRRREAAPGQAQRHATGSAASRTSSTTSSRQLIRRFGARDRRDRAGSRSTRRSTSTRSRQARQAIADHEGEPGDPAAALVTIDPRNGHIVAMATSSSYGQTKFNYATAGPPPDGLGVQGVRADDADPRLRRRPRTPPTTSRTTLPPGWLPGYPTYHVQTAEHSYQGTISLTKATLALRQHRVRAARRRRRPGQGHADGLRDGHHLAPRRDSRAEAIGGLRIGVSPLEMADAYATLANGGYHIAPTAITKVVFPDGQRRSTSATRTHKQVFTDGEAYAGDPGPEDRDPRAAPAPPPTRLPGGRQDRHHQQLHRRVVRRLHAPALDGGVGRLSRTRRVDERRQRARPGFGGTLAAPIWHDYMEAGERRLLRRLHAADGSVAGHPRSSGTSRRPARRRRSPRQRVRARPARAPTAAAPTTSRSASTQTTQPVEHRHRRPAARRRPATGGGGGPAPAAEESRSTEAEHAVDRERSAGP